MGKSGQEDQGNREVLGKEMQCAERIHPGAAKNPAWQEGQLTQDLQETEANDRVGSLNEVTAFAVLATCYERF